ncbi:MAG: phosphoglycerate dehydrogenase [Cytophagales bacterium]|nr:MAG: phosphoglycerate dehydrogenase [Cytophagales bacterium]
MKILIVDEMHSSLMPMLAAIGIHADYRPKITPEEIYQTISSYQGIIVRSKIQINETLLEKAHALQLIARAGSGMDNIDTEATKKRAIHLINTPEGNRDSVAEHVIGMILCLFNHIHTADQQIRQQVWNREVNRGIEIKGKTIGIIGYGNIGYQLAKRLANFECELLVYDKNTKNYPIHYARQTTLEEIWQKADILSIHIPLNENNRQWIDEHFLARFQKPIYLINSSRGEIIKTEALIEHLKQNKILGACLDVLENEKLDKLTPKQREEFLFLSQAPNILFTPHVAGWTEESYQRINEVIVEKIKLFLSQ